MTNLTKDRAVPDTTPKNPLSTNNIYSLFAKIALPITFDMPISDLYRIVIPLLPSTVISIFFLLLEIFVSLQREISNKLTMENVS